MAQGPRTAPGSPGLGEGIGVFVAALVLMQAVSCSRDVPPQYVGVLHYIPLGVETLVPVRPEQLEKYANAHLLLSEQDLESIREVTARATASQDFSASFYEDYSRIKVRDYRKGTEILIDNTGRVRRPDGTGRLSDDDKLTLRRLVEEIAARTGLPAKYLQSRPKGS